MLGSQRFTPDGGRASALYLSQHGQGVLSSIWNRMTHSLPTLVCDHHREVPIFVVFPLLSRPKRGPGSNEAVTSINQSDHCDKEQF
jgi:hypothetical protein